MTPRQLKNIVNDRFQVDISTKSRKRSIVYPKKVYCYLAYNLDYPLMICAEEINLQHDNLIFHKNTIGTVYDFYKTECNNIILWFNLKSSILKLDNTNKLKKKEEVSYIINMLHQLNNNQLKTLRETRIEPFIKMLIN